MPFDLSGNFTRSQNFTQDRDNGIKILAGHVDGEFDNFALGMNQVFFRNGLVPMSGTLNLGLNPLTGLIDGTAASPSTRFASDVTTGIYLDAVGKLALSAGGVKRADFAAGGVNFYSPVSLGSALTITAGGIAVTGNSTFANNVAITGTLGAGATTLSNTLTVSAGGAIITAGGLTVSAGGAAVTGNSSVTGTLLVTGALTNNSTLHSLGAITADAGITVTAGGTNVTGNSQFNNNLTTGGTLIAGGSIQLASNNFQLQFTDVSGTHPYMICDNANTLALYSTDAAGAARAVFGITARNGGAALNVYPNLVANGTLTVVGAASAASLTLGAALGSAYGGTGVTTGTGTGNNVLSDSPALTGTPTAPTAAINTSSTQLATTAFVDRLRDATRVTGGLTRGQVFATSAGFTVNNANAGEIYMAYNDSAASITITQGGATTLRLHGTTSTGNRTLAARGMCTIWYNASNEAVILGDVS